jgi:curved DNA-binding protein CbpA
MTQNSQGKLADQPLVELIRQIGEASTSGALRLARDRAKTVIYFESGAVIFAASNLRAHRLLDFLKRTGAVSEASLSGLSTTTSDDELLSQLAKNGVIDTGAADILRLNQVAEILRGVLLWTEGEWQFDPKVRLSDDTRVTIDAGRLLLEASRHLPAAYVNSRFRDANEQIEPATLNGQPANLLPSEAKVLSRVTGATTIKALTAASGVPEEQIRRAVYSLAICGAIKRRAESQSQSNSAQSAKGDAKDARPAAEQVENLEDFLGQLEQSVNHYQVLGVTREASRDDIKKSYHSLARRYHPDRFQQSEEKLRNQIESAFARVARAHEVLTDPSSRSEYDRKLSALEAPAPRSGSVPAQTPTKTPNETRAEASFQKGMTAMAQNQLPQAVRFFAEAANLGPRCARYHAEYGRSLISDPATRRLAEIELKAAISLEPQNISYRVVLAELYKALGLKRRAEGELQRALVDDPKNAAARTLLASLKD